MSENNPALHMAVTFCQHVFDKCAAIMSKDPLDDKVRKKIRLLKKKARDTETDMLKEAGYITKKKKRLI